MKLQLLKFSKKDKKTNTDFSENIFVQNFSATQIGEIQEIKKRNN